MLAGGHEARVRIMTAAKEITVRAPCLKDGGKLMELVHAAGTLDVNSCYLYYLLADHFSSTCAYAEAEGEPAGFVTAYRLPDEPTCLFVWQITVSPAFRGCGIGQKLLVDLAGRPWFREIQRVCCTISPSNEASRRLFAKWGESLGGHWHETPYLRAEDLGATHEDEPMLTIELSHGGA